MIKALIVVVVFLVVPNCLLLDQPDKASLCSTAAIQIIRHNCKAQKLSKMIFQNRAAAKWCSVFMEGLGDAATTGKRTGPQCAALPVVRQWISIGIATCPTGEIDSQMDNLVATAYEEIDEGLRFLSCGLFRGSNYEKLDLSLYTSSECDTLTI